MDLATELFGYIAMVLLVVSFIPKQIRIIRGINLCACIFFVVYGILLGLKWPIIISNGLIAAIQVYHLFAGKTGVNKMDS